jgi:hypothetical protein
MIRRLSYIIRREARTIRRQRAEARGMWRWEGWEQPIPLPNAPMSARFNMPHTDLGLVARDDGLGFGRRNWWDNRWRRREQVHIGPGPERPLDNDRSRPSRNGPITLRKWGLDSDERQERDRGTDGSGEVGRGLGALRNRPIGLRDRGALKSDDEAALNPRAARGRNDDLLR